MRLVEQAAGMDSLPAEGLDVRRDRVEDRRHLGAALGTGSDIIPATYRQTDVAALGPVVVQRDPRVVEVPRPIWWMVLNGVILNTRPKKSAHAYKQVWTEEGSPLAVITRQQAEAMQLIGAVAQQVPDIEFGTLSRPSEPRRAPMKANARARNTPARPRAPRATALPTQRRCSLCSTVNTWL